MGTGPTPFGTCYLLIDFFGNWQDLIRGLFPLTPYSMKPLMLLLIWWSFGYGHSYPVDDSGLDRALMDSFPGHIQLLSFGSCFQWHKFAPQMGQVTLGLLWKDSSWDKCLRCVLIPGGLFPALSPILTSKLSSLQLASIPNKSTNLLLNAFYHNLHCLRMPLALNSFTFCSK